MLIDRPEIARLIPHTGEMCLLDGVVSWDERRLRCLTTTHRSASNPLRRGDRLGILCGVEYAAQAMAVHAALGNERGGVRRGYLASLRAVSCYECRLDLIPGTLIVGVERIHDESSGMIYDFALRHDDRMLLSGRAAVALMA